MEYQITSQEVAKLIATGCEVGFQRCMELVGERPRFISQSKAYKRFTCARVRNWVADGLIKPKPNGNGKTSTIQYELLKLMELDASEKIIIRKPYI